MSIKCILRRVYLSVWSLYYGLKKWINQHESVCVLFWFYYFDCVKKISVIYVVVAMHTLCAFNSVILVSLYDADFRVTAFHLVVVGNANKIRFISLSYIIRSGRRFVEFISNVDTSKWTQVILGNFSWDFGCWHSISARTVTSNQELMTLT